MNICKALRIAARPERKVEACLGRNLFTLFILYAIIVICIVTVITKNLRLRWQKF